MKSAAEYWDVAAETYAQDFTDTVIGRTRREAVWRELDRVFLPGRRVLELNCGTGIDAVHLAGKGVRILACDIAPRMVELAHERARAAGLSEAVDFRVLPTEDVGALHAEGPFDGAFSNFSGLNCVDDLGAVARNLSRLLRPGAPLLISMMGRFVPWEIVWFLAQARPGKALRRFEWRTPHSVQHGALKVQCPAASEITNLFTPHFTLRNRKGIGILVPPSYAEPWVRRFPKTIQALAKVDRHLSAVPGLRSLADCALFEFSRHENG